MEQPVQDSHPPRALLSVVNPIFRAVLGSRLGRNVNGFAVLEFAGRRTGKRYRVVVGWHEVDGASFAVTPETWRLNFEGGAPLTVRHRGRKLEGRGRLVTDAAETARMLNRLQDKGTKLRDLGLTGPQGHRVTEQDVVAVHRDLVYFEPST